MSKPVKNINELLSQGLENHRAKQFTMAKQLYLEILEECPQHPDALNLLGTAIAQDDEPEKAIQFIQQAIVFRPELAPYRVNLGVVLQDLGRFDQAEASFQYAIQLDEKFVDAYYNLAKLYKQVEKPISAIKTYKKLPLYTLIKAFGPRHKPIFKISVNIPNSKKFIGSGNSKQQAEQDGAKKLLENIKIE